MNFAFSPLAPRPRKKIQIDERCDRLVQEVPQTG